MVFVFVLYLISMAARRGTPTPSTRVQKLCCCVVVIECLTSYIFPFWGNTKIGLIGEGLEPSPPNLGGQNLFLTESLFLCFEGFLLA